MCPDHMVTTNIHCSSLIRYHSLCTKSSAVSHSDQFLGGRAVKEDKQSNRTPSLSLVIHRVRFPKNLQKSTLAFKGGGGEGNETQKAINFSGKLTAATAATYIFTAFTCTITIISLEPCALNAEFQPVFPFS
jgi:hypothetical protein